MLFITVTDGIVLALGAVFLLIWLSFYAKGKKDEALFRDLNDTDYPFHEIYFVGYAVTQQLKMDYKTKSARRLRKQLGSLYEAKYADYYLRVVYSQQITMGLTVLALAAPMYFLSQNIAMFLLMVAGAGATWYYYGLATRDLIKKKMDDYLSEFSDVVSKLALLVNSGMILTDAWKKTAESSDRPIYLEMQKSVLSMENGISAAEALNTFGQRCFLPEIRKFTSTLIQGINKGNAELSVMLIQQSKEVWELKKQLAKRKGELADSKLLLPMCLTFIGILIMVIVPIFSNLGV